MKKQRRYLFFLVAMLLVMLVPQIALSNSAEPPAVIVIVNNPSADLKITMVSKGTTVSPRIQKVAWESYYYFYLRGESRYEDYSFKVEYEGKSFTQDFGTGEKKYKEIYSLDLKKEEVVKGRYPFRGFILVSLRVLLTLLIEGLIFFLFRFKSPGAFKIFLVVNLVTQGALNIWLNSVSTVIVGYFFIALIVGEFFVFIIEMIAFPKLLKEDKKLKAVGYAFIANLASLFLGGFLISLLPV